VCNEDYLYGILDAEGNVLLPLKYKSIGNFVEGMAVVSVVKDDFREYYGFVDESGVEVIPCDYSGAADFADGVARVLNDNGWSFIDRDGNEVN
jgi:hypothetical protein